MKRVVMTWNIGRSSKQIRQLLVTGRMFAIMSLGSMVVVIIIGIGAILQQKAMTSPISSMKGFAATVSSGLFTDMLAMEMKETGEKRTESAISGNQVSHLLVRLLTDINPSDPKSLLAREFPGFDGDDAFLLRSGSAIDASVEPQDREPLTEDQTTGDSNPLNPPESEDPNNNSDQTPSDKPISTDINPDPTLHPAVKPQPSKEPNLPLTPSVKPNTGGQKVVFIYHSHNRESWFPELKNSKIAESPTKNITLLGKRLEEKLEANGIGTVHSSTDYPSSIKNFNWVLSYKYSKKTVTEALSSNKELKYFFDIHRDSQHRKNTTTTINGKSYAQVFFIIGHANNNWKKNEAFANQIHQELDKKYPGISRGIWGKTTANGNGEYNQTIAPDSVLIEVGGIDNTLEESYRTIDALAKVISQLYWSEEKVIAPNIS